MARRRGFFAEIQHQNRLAEQRHAAAQRQQAAAVRKAEQAQRHAERLHTQALRASEADRKRLEKEAAAAHVEARIAETEQLNGELAVTLATLDGILAATLDVDDYVDLETLRAVAEHPPFPRDDLRAPIPAPAPIADPPLPVKQAPAPVKGLFGKKDKEAAALEAVERQYANDYWGWHAANESLPARREAQAAAHAEQERARLAQLSEVTAKYEAESAAREAEVADQNRALDELINGLAYGSVDAVQEYVSIVLANSVYPEWFPVTHTAVFDPAASELALRVLIPGPENVPNIRGYRYTKASDEISPIAATQKDVKDRYARIVNNVALRSVHEVFEADRRGLIRAISVELGTETISPATGRPIYIPFVALATTRESFEDIDLASVVPAATLEHLGAAVSKNPQGLVAIAPNGVRRA